MLFVDRRAAGRHLAAKLLELPRRKYSIVLALPRGGVPVGFEVAKALGVALDVFLVRKLGAPGRPELAIGAIASGGVRVLNPEMICEFAVTPAEIEVIAEIEGLELVRRESLYRAGRPQLKVRRRNVILVDDGLATGSTMRAAIEAIRKLQPARVTVAVPVGSKRNCRKLAKDADELVCAEEPDPFHAVGDFYVDFEQTTDAQVIELLGTKTRKSAAKGG